LGKLLGGTYYRIDRFRRRVIRANISVVFGRELDHRQREILGKESCECLATNVLDLLRLDRIVNSENYHRFIEIKGFSNLMKSIERGKGTVVLTGHFGNMVLLRYACYLNIPPRSVIIRKLDDPYLEHYVTSILKAHDVTMVRPDGALKRMRQLLLQNTLVVTLADQKAGGSRRGGRDGIVVDFFGIPSQTHITGPFLARRTGASIVPVFVIRKGPGKYTIEVNEPLKLVHTDDEQGDLKQNTRKLNQIFEHYIRRYPEQWFWLHRRWKDIPGLEHLYETSDPLTLIEKFRRVLSKG
jgi:KDO2-lipid IV(A) lauroyltransferase